MLMFLYVVTPTVISVYPEDGQMNYTVNEGDSVTFECSATGIPAPEIIWYRNGEELNSTTDPRITINDPSDAVNVVRNSDNETVIMVTRTLTFEMTKDVDSSDLYECSASNNAGVDSQMFELIVQGEEGIDSIGYSLIYIRTEFR